jgi:hypothetical protein
MSTSKAPVPDEPDDFDDEPDTTVPPETTPPKPMTIEDVLTAIAAKVDHLTEKVRHMDQFREDTLAQLDTMSNAMHEAKLGGVQEQGDGQKTPVVNPEVLKGAIDSANSLATNIFDMIYKWKTASLQDPFDQKRLEYGDRVLRRVANDEIGQQARQIIHPPRDNKYDKMFVADHGSGKNIR